MQFFGVGLIFLFGLLLNFTQADATGFPYLVDAVGFVHEVDARAHADYPELFAATKRDPKTGHIIFAVPYLYINEANRGNFLVRVNQQITGNKFRKWVRAKYWVVDGRTRGILIDVNMQMPRVASDKRSERERRDENLFILSLLLTHAVYDDQGETSICRRALIAD